MERRQFCAASPSLVERYSNMSLSLVSVSFQRNPRPSKIGCRVSMKTLGREISRPPARQRSQKPRIRSFSGKPVRPWLTSQFIRRRRGVNSMSHYGAQSRATKGCYDFARVTFSPSSLTKEATGWSSKSSTASDGRHSLVPFGDTTIGRLIRIGCASMKSISSSSLHLGSPKFQGIFRSAGLDAKKSILQLIACAVKSREKRPGIDAHCTQFVQNLCPLFDR